MSRVGGQRRMLGELLGSLRPHWHSDAGLPARIDRLLGRDRRIGSGDRRLYRELIYTTLRYLPWVEPILKTDPAQAESRIAWLAADLPSTRLFRAEATAGMPPCPPDLAAKAALLGAEADAVLPEWLRQENPFAYEPRHRDRLIARAPLWVRLQGERSDEALGEFEARGWTCRPSAAVNGAVALPTEADVRSTDAFLQGAVEIQDVGSQWVLASAHVAEGGRWLDACAGAGGKTLQLAHLVGAGGHVTAHDVRAAPLEELRARATRAGLEGRITVARVPEGVFDGVLVDAPCSGSGTFRRSPHLKWTTSAASVREAARVQGALLRSAATSVRAGGRLIYATCSLCRSENESVVADFLEHSGSAFTVDRPTEAFGAEQAGAGSLLWPDTLDGDGFYAALLRKNPT